LRAADAQDIELVLTLVLQGERLGAGTAEAGEERHCFDERGDTIDDASAPTESVTVRIAPAPRVLLFGAGPETRPLLALTRRLGWRVELAEHRERWLRFAASAGVDAEHRGGPDEFDAIVARACFDAALVMNHNLELDARSLRALAGSRIPYIGLLGPPARRDDLLNEIGDNAGTRLGARLRAPVGLPLGGEGAEAIALAITAELQRDFSRGAGA
jgi:xanthine dehydrogenase accessory factor